MSVYPPGGGSAGGAVSSVVGQTGDVTAAQIAAATAGSTAGTLAAGNDSRLIQGNATTADPTASNDSSQRYAAGSRWLNTATGVWWSCYSAAVGAAVWVPMGFADHPGYATGQSYQLNGGLPNGGSTVNAADTLYLFPFSLKARAAVTALFLRCTAGGAGSAVKAAVWRNGPAGRPIGTPVLSNNTGVATTVAGLINLPVTGTPNPGVYWFGSKFTPTLPGMAMLGANSSMGDMVGGAASAMLSSVAMVVGVSTPDAFGNDIAATDLTSATFASLGINQVPAAGITF